MVPKFFKKMSRNLMYGIKIKILFIKLNVFQQKDMYVIIYD
jgi:hypothetical protein